MVDELTAERAVGVRRAVGARMLGAVDAAQKVTRAPVFRQEPQHRDEREQHQDELAGFRLLPSSSRPWRIRSSNAATKPRYPRSISSSVVAASATARTSGPSLTKKSTTAARPWWAARAGSALDPRQRRPISYSSPPTSSSRRRTS